MAKKFGLGRGLGSLIPDKNGQPAVQNDTSGDQVAVPVEELVETSPSPLPSAAVGFASDKQKIENIEPKYIVTSHFQPRQIFEHTALEELVNSIKEYGILEPLIVSPLSDGRYKLVAGERRLRAAKILDLKTVPVIARTVSEQQRIEISMIENIQRRDLNPIEEAVTYDKLIEEFHLTQDEVAKKVGKSRSRVANSLRLLGLPKEIQNLLASGKLTVGHAKVIMELGTPEEQLRMVKRVLGQKLSVREIEQKVRVKIGKQPTPVSEKIKQAQERIAEYLKTKVKIKSKRNGGIIEIEYYSAEELENIIEKLSE